MCVRHEDLIENTTTFLLDFQDQFRLRTKPGFPYEARAAHTCPFPIARIHSLEPSQDAASMQRCCALRAQQPSCDAHALMWRFGAACRMPCWFVLEALRHEGSASESRL
jgi:hypothetical protein